jgi:hypothetical protein
MLKASERMCRETAWIGRRRELTSEITIRGGFIDLDHLSQELALEFSRAGLDRETLLALAGPDHLIRDPSRLDWMCSVIEAAGPALQVFE